MTPATKLMLSRRVPRHAPEALILPANMLVALDPPATGERGAGARVRWREEVVRGR